MTSNEKAAAINALNEIQQQIEAFEASWQKSDNWGEKEDLDHRIDRLLSQRNGMENLMESLEIEFGRRDWVDRKGTNYTPRTIWYLI